MKSDVLSLLQYSWFSKGVVHTLTLCVLYMLNHFYVDKKKKVDPDILLEVNIGHGKNCSFNKSFPNVYTWQTGKAFKRDRIHIRQTVKCQSPNNQLQSILCLFSWNLIDCYGLLHLYLIYMVLIYWAGLLVSFYLKLAIDVFFFFSVKK